MRRLRNSLRRGPRKRHVALLVLVALIADGAALGFFDATGSSTGSTSIGSINPPSSVTAQRSQANVTVEWSAATLSSGGGVQGYRVTRSDGASVCGSPTLVTTLSCVDHNVAPGTYTYSVTAVYKSFDASASSGSITVKYSPDGSGNLTTPTTSVSASSSGNTITFTYTAATGGMLSGALTIAVPTGWNAPSTTGSAAGYTTSSTGTLSISGQKITVSELTLAAGQTMTIVYGSTASSGPGAKAPSSTGEQTWQVQEKSTAAGTLTNLESSPSITVYAPDGSGTLTAPTANVSASSTDTITFTYTAASGGLSGGEVDVAVPSGWTTPTTSNASGCSTASTGAVSVSVSTIKVSGVALSGGATMTITYGATSGGSCASGDGARAQSSGGTATFATSEKSTSGGILTNLASSPSVGVVAADGSGTMIVSPTNVSAATSGNTLTFTYTAPAGGLSGGEVDVAVPAGWTTPTTANAVGCTTASSGTASVSGSTIQVTALTLSGAQTLTITYGAKTGGSCTSADGATAPGAEGISTFTTSEKSTSGGALTNLVSSPQVTNFPAKLVSWWQAEGNANDSVDGNAGTLHGGVTFGAGNPGQAFSFDGLTGYVEIGNPTNLQSKGSSFTIIAEVRFTSLSGDQAIVNKMVPTSSGPNTNGWRVLKQADNHFWFCVGRGSNGCISGSSTTARSATAATTGVWYTVAAVYSAGTGMSLYVNGTLEGTASGSGVVNTDVAPMLFGSYPTGSFMNGQIDEVRYYNQALSASEVDPPSVTEVTPNAGPHAGGTSVTITGANFTGATSVKFGANPATGVTVNSGTSITASAPAGTGSVDVTVTTPGGTSTPTPADLFTYSDTGTMTASPSNVSGASTGDTVAFTYTAPAGGVSGGEVTLAAPSGWTAPTTSDAAGCTTASTGSVSISGSTIEVSGVTLTGGQTLTITYGATSGGACKAGDGATAPSSTGAQTWPARVKFTSGGTLTNLASSPSLTVNAADGSGTMTVSPASAAQSSTGNTLTFTYTAASGALSGGEVDLTVPAGWTTPTTSNANGCTTASTGTASISGSTIEVSGVALSASSTLTITYGATSGGSCGSGDGAVAQATGGTATFTTSEKSTASGTLTNIASSPSVMVFAANGSGTMTVSPATASYRSSANTLTFTYTAASGGISGGEVDVTVPTNWTGPTTANNVGCTIASAGSLSVSNGTIKVSGLTLAAGATVTITYGATSGGVCTAKDTVFDAGPEGPHTWEAQEKSISSGTLTNMPASPSLYTYDEDGRGTMSVSPTNVYPSSTGNTLTFTFTAPSAATSGGEVDVAVPSGWTTPTTSNAPGCTTASTGALAISGSTIKVSGVTLGAGSTITITYGATSGGSCALGDSATAQATPGTPSFTTSEKSTASGTLTNIAGSPTMTVNAFDGSGTMTVSPASVAASSSGNTLVFTYTASGPISGGEIDFTVPAGWSTPTRSNVPGCTLAQPPGYTQTISGSTVKFSGVTMSTGSTFTIYYGNAGFGGCNTGVVAQPTAGTATFTASEKSTTGGTLANLASSPSVNVLFAEHAKLVGPVAGSAFGRGVALSSDGNTALVGAPTGTGAAWVYTRSGGVWSEQQELTGAGEIGEGQFGISVALSSDGNTALIGGYTDNGNKGAAWVYTRSGGVWSEQQELTGAGEIGEGQFGRGVALSSDGNTALIGGYTDNGKGAAWVFTRSGGVWSQKQKLTGGGEVGSGGFGLFVALSSDAGTALIGALLDNSEKGAAWVFKRSGEAWSETQKLTGGGEVGGGNFGSGVALSSDGSTALIGGYFDNSHKGAAWAFTRSGEVFSEQQKLTGGGEIGASQFGISVALSSDGSTGLIGGYADNSVVGAAWVFKRSGGSWSEQQKLTGGGEVGGAVFGYSVALSSDAGTALIGGYRDNSERGAAWAF